MDELYRLVTDGCGYLIALGADGTELARVEHLDGDGPADFLRLTLAAWNALEDGDVTAAAPRVVTDDVGCGCDDGDCGAGAVAR
jgi:hypothetical protein